MAHLQNLLTILALIGVAFTVERKAKISFSTSILYAVISVSIFLYFGALLNCLELAATTVRIVGWLGLIICLLQFNKREIKADEIYIFVSAVAFYLFCQTAPYSIFPFIDDYSHWGRMSQVITENNRLVINSDVVGNKDYPPIAALFHYFFTHFSGYQENIVIFSNGLLIIFFSAPILIKVSQYKAEEKKIAFALISLSLYSFFWIFGFGLHSLWGDLLLGFSFGIGLYVYFNQEWRSKNTALLATIPILIYTIQVKQIGILFSIFTLAIIGVDYLKYEKNKLCYKFIKILLTSITLILFQWTWKNYLDAQGMQRAFNISLTQIFSFFNQSTISDRQSITVSRFVDYFFFSHHLSTFWFIVTLLLFSGVAALKKINNLELKLTPFILSYFLFIVYSIVLLILYLFSFSPWEGPRLASIDRYILTYLLGLLIFLSGALINIGSEIKVKKYKIFLIAISLLIILPNTGRILLDTVRVILNTYPTYTAGEISQISGFVNEKTPDSSRIYIIWSEGSNDESVIFSYFLRPRLSNTSCSFVKPPNSIKTENDPWSCLMSIEQFNETISSYDYLLLARPSEEFVNYFLDKFNIEYSENQSILFKIMNLKELKLVGVR